MAEEAGPADWQPVGGQRNATISEENDPLDVTTKDTGNGANEYDYGLYGWNISGDGIYTTGDAAYAKLKADFRAKKKVKVRIRENGTFTEEGMAIINTMETEAPYDDAATYSIELQGTGLLTAVVLP